MEMAATEGEYRKSALAWDLMSLGIGARVVSLAAFALLYSLFVILGLALRESSQQLTILWPAAGILFMALWQAPRRNWILILGVQMCVEFAIAAVHSDHFTFRQYTPFVLA